MGWTSFRLFQRLRIGLEPEILQYIPSWSGTCRSPIAGTSTNKNNVNLQWTTNVAHVLCDAIAWCSVYKNVLVYKGQLSSLYFVLDSVTVAAGHISIGQCPLTPWGHYFSGDTPNY